MQYKGKLKGLELHKGRKSKNSKCVGTWFNAIGSMFKTRHARHTFNLELVREKDSTIILLTTYRTGLLTSLLYFTLLYSPSPFYLDKIINLSPNSFPSFFVQILSDLEKFIPSRIFILYSCRWSLNSVH